jgi:hypothetical protein
MHFHLPKPLHGWREFIGEVGIIVIGILIALGGEQVVEAIHWREQVRLEREALQTEVVGNLDAVRLRLLLEPCVRVRLREVSRILDDAERGIQPKLATRVGFPLPSGASRGAWNIAVTGDALSHMPIQAQLDFSGAFANFENWDEIRREEFDAWTRLDVLDQKSRLSTTDLAGLRQALAQAIAIDGRLTSIGPFIFQTASVGQKPDQFTLKEAFGVAGYGSDFCKPLLPNSDRAGEP